MTFAGVFVKERTMKKLAITAFVLGMLAMGFPAQPAQAEVSVRVSIGRFYNELAPHGRWVSCRYGRCWVPRRVSRRWQPYTNGRWVYTDYGWTWVSRDTWGGTPYHYGTWTYLRGYGWAWVPGTVWAPAWVTWSYSDRYVGWAPLPPSFACGESGYSGRPVVVSQSQYVFVPANRFVDTDVSPIWLPTTQNAAIFQQTRAVTSFGVSNGIVRNVGVPVAAIQGAAGGRIETRSISAANTAPEPVTVGGGGKGRRFAVVAPAREVSAAVAAGPREAVARPEVSSRAAKAPKVRGEAPPAQARSQAREAAPVEQRQPKGQRVREAPPGQPQAAPAEQRQPKAQKFREAPPGQPQAAPVEQRQPKAQKFREAPPGQPQAAPAEQRQPKAPKGQKDREAPPAQPQGQAPPPRAEAAPGAQPAPAAQAAPPKQEPAHEKPAKPEKDKKEKDKKDN
jgi:hypothetical protein